MDQTILFTFGLTIFGFVIVGLFAYSKSVKQESKIKMSQYANWGD